MPRPAHSFASRYGVAVAAVVAAATARVLLDPVLGNMLPFITLFPAILAAAWYGGLGPAAAATALGGAVAAAGYLPPVGSLAVALPEHRAGLSVYAAVGLGIAALGGRMRAAQVRAEGLAAEAARQREELRTTLRSIGDAVVVTDAAGLVVSLNPVAEVLTGWAAADAAGRPLAEVFVIVNEDTRRAVESPVARVLREGVVVGLANHTVLLAKGGAERPIDDSAAPVRDAAGRLTGVVLVFRDVTERRRAEEADRRLAAIVESSDDAVVGKDLDGRITSWNAGAERVYGYAAGEVLGRPFAVLVPADRAGEVADAARRLAAGERLDHFETVRRRKDGTRIDVSVSYSPVKADDGRLVGTAVITRDVTGRKRAEAALRETEATLRGFYDAAPVFMGVTEPTPDGDVLHLFDNPASCRFFGVEPGATAGRRAAADLGADPAVVARWRAGYAASAAAGRPAHFDHEYPTPAGPRWLSATVAPVGPGPAGRPRFCYVAEDVTDRTRAEAALRESEERLRQLTDALPVLISYIDTDRRYQLVNRRYEGWFGRPREEIRGKSMWEVLGAAAYESIRPHVEAALAGREVTYEQVIPYRDIGPRHIHGEYVPDRAGGMVRGFFALISDVTASKRAEADAKFLAAASATLADLADEDSTLQKVARLAVPGFGDWAVVDLLDGGGRLRRVAVAHADPTKVDLARDLHRRFPPDPDAPQGAGKVARTGAPELVPEITDEQLAAVVPDPDRLAVLRALGLRSYLGVPLAARGRVLGVLTFVAAESGRRYGPGDLATAEDLAGRAAVAVENARLYQAVREADRRKDEFLAVLGHELRNPLAPIRSALDALNHPAADGRVPAPTLEMMGRQVGHMVRLVDDLLDVSRIVRGKVELRTEPTDLGAVVRRAAEAAGPLIEAEGHTLDLDLPPGPVVVAGDPDRLAQVVGNLLTNAARYTERGGRVAVAVRPDGGRAVVSVRDTGVGIPADAVGRIWDMFVQADRRTKASRGGMGVGLALVKGLVEAHGGAVEARSDGPGRGSEFTVSLPLHDPAAAPPPPPPAARPAAPAARRVLVVDDNEDAAESLAMLLRLDGHEVAVAHDGPAALRAAAAAPPEVAFLDLGMPGMDGYEVARRVRADPALSGVTLVALTGWGQDEDRRRTAAAGFDAHEVKPVGMDALRRLLGRPE